MKIIVKDEQEARAVNTICDLAVKAGGLQVAEAAVVMSKSIIIEEPKCLKVNNTKTCAKSDSTK